TRFFLALELAQDGGGVDAKQLRGERLVALGGAERLLEQPRLDLGERRPETDREHALRERRRAGDLRWQVGHVHERALGEHDAAPMRTSTRKVFVPPRRSNSPSWSTRKILGWVTTERSETSSRKSVPPLASSKRPSFRPAAPVNAPFS